MNSPNSDKIDSPNNILESIFDQDNNMEMGKPPTDSYSVFVISSKILNQKR